MNILVQLVGDLGALKASDRPSDSPTQFWTFWGHQLIAENWTNLTLMASDASASKSEGRGNTDLLSLLEIPAFFFVSFIGAMCRRTEGSLR